MQKIHILPAQGFVRLETVLSFVPVSKYRIHNPSLAGKPDIAFTVRKKAIFVHGCFWHGHTCRKGLNRPAENASYWNEKIEKTILRDQKNTEHLISVGWSVLILWECELRDKIVTQSKIQQFLEPTSYGM